MRNLKPTFPTGLREGAQEGQAGQGLCFRPDGLRAHMGFYLAADLPQKVQRAPTGGSPPLPTVRTEGNINFQGKQVAGKWDWKR